MVFRGYPQIFRKPSSVSVCVCSKQQTEHVFPRRYKRRAPSIEDKLNGLVGKSTGNHGFSHEIWRCPAILPLPIHSQTLRAIKP